MYESIVVSVLTAMDVYLALGLVFAIAFVIFGVGKIDGNAVKGSWGFRLLILPGCMALWPLLLKRWLQKSTSPPDECSPHICASREPRQ